MSKPKMNKVYNFFKRSPNSTMYVCQVDKCNMVIPPHTYGLERHIKHTHYAVYKRDFLNHNDNSFNINKRTDDAIVSSLFKITKKPTKYDRNANGLTVYEEKLLLQRQKIAIEKHMKNCFWCIHDKLHSNKILCKKYLMLKRT